MPKKELTIEQRVDLLLYHGVDSPKKWAAVHGYTEPDNYDKYDQDGHFNSVCFDVLREHHIEETTFLFDVIRELAKRCNACPACRTTMQPSEGCFLCPTCGHSRG